MPISPSSLPFELLFNEKRGWWAGRWREEKLRVAVAGTEASPSREHLDTLRDLVARWPETPATVSRFLRALAPDAEVHLEPRKLGYFLARNCGFGEELNFESLTVVREPDLAITTFYTGFPDGYATFAVSLRGAEPVSVTAFAA